MTKSNLGERIYFIVQLVTYYSEKTWQKLKEEPGGRIKSEDMKETLLTNLLSVDCFACTSPGVVPPTVGWDFAYQSSIKKRHHSIVHRTIGWGIFLI